MTFLLLVWPSYQFYDLHITQTIPTEPVWTSSDKSLSSLRYLYLTEIPVTRCVDPFCWKFLLKYTKTNVVIQPLLFSDFHHNFHFHFTLWKVLYTLKPLQTLHLEWSSLFFMSVRYFYITYFNYYWYKWFHVNTDVLSKRCCMCTSWLNHWQPATTV